MSEEKRWVKIPEELNAKCREHRQNQFFKAAWMLVKLDASGKLAEIVAALCDNCKRRQGNG